jgi:hypothetical protein
MNTEIFDSQGSFRSYDRLAMMADGCDERWRHVQRRWPC